MPSFPTPTIVALHRSKSVPHHRLLPSPFLSLHHGSRRRRHTATDPSHVQTSFPWRTCDSPQRTTSPPSLRSPLAKYLFDPIKVEVTRFFAKTFIHQAYGEGYTENQFLAGATQALEAFCQACGRSSLQSLKGRHRRSPHHHEEEEDDPLSSLLSRPLYERLSTGIASHALDRNETVSLSLDSLHDARISNYSVLFGPRVGTAARPRLQAVVGRNRWYLLDAGSEYVMFRGSSVGTLCPREENASARSTYQLGTRAMDEGAVMSIDVTFDCEITYTVVRERSTDDEREATVTVDETTSSEPTTAGTLARKVSEELSTRSDGSRVVYTDTCRRDLVLVFEGKHATQEECREGAALGNNHWTIADVDSLMESDRYQVWVKDVKKRIKSTENAER
ncbi:hypothetical protein HKX48_003800 [Thoreauomyces humboldtii]|nr:hypothetical protein HKX48_003800 [Thoreauomyces humboldtii]